MPNQPSDSKQLVAARLPRHLIDAMDKAFTPSIRNRTELIIAAIEKYLKISKPSK